MTDGADSALVPESPRLKVLIVDDSAFMRASLRHIVSTAPGWEVVGEAADGQQALAVIETLKPDAVTLDVDMPVLDGIGVLRTLRPQPGTAPAVIMVSAFTTQGAALTLNALALGALDFVPKASEYFSTDLAQVGEMLREKLAAVAGIARGDRPVPAVPVASLAGASLSRQPLPMPPSAEPLPLLPLPLAATPLGQARHVAVQARPIPAAAAPLSPIPAGDAHHVVPDVVVMTASTGGPQTLPVVLRAAGVLPLPVVIAQHIPPLFSRSLAQSLSASLDLPVMEAEDGQVLAPGRIYLLPGGTNGEITRPVPGKLGVRLVPGAGVAFRPNADILFRSAALNAKRPVGVILTGMGADGREGARALHQRRRPVLVQNPATAVIWGMPQAAVNAGVATAVLDAADIGRKLAEMSAWRARA